MSESMKPGTPLPWEAAPDGCLRRETPSGTDFLPIASPWVESAFTGDETAVANAEYIVAACNAYPDLIEGLREARTLIQVLQTRYAAQYSASPGHFSNADLVADSYAEVSAFRARLDSLLENNRGGESNG